MHVGNMALGGSSTQTGAWRAGAGSLVQRRWPRARIEPYFGATSRQNVRLGHWCDDALDGPLECLTDWYDSASMVDALRAKLPPGVRRVATNPQVSRRTARPSPRRRLPVPSLPPAMASVGPLDGRTSHGVTGADCTGRRRCGCPHASE
jgi:hypothetical protein